MTQIDKNSASVEDNTKFKDGVNRNARLIIRNISFKATEDDLKKHFAPYGTVEEVNLLRRPDGKLVGCGFVHFTHVPMANKALAETNKKQFLGRPITVAWAVSKHKYDETLQGNEPKKRLCSGTQSEEKNARSPVKEEIKEESKEDKNKTRINRNARLIVRNISFKATEESLKEHFAPYGTILEVKLLKKPDGKLVGCAFVHFKNVPMAKKALLNTNMKPFLGRPISVDWAVAKNKYMQFVVEQQLDMQDKVKKEDPDDSADDDAPINISNDDLKKEIKSESEESDDEDVKTEDESDASNKDDDDSEEDSGDGDDSEVDDNDDDDQSVVSNQVERQRIKLNDAEDGCTVFLTNIAFSVDNDLLKQFAEKVGPVKYALVCVDKLTEHSKGTGFIKFVNEEDANKFLALPPEELRLEGQTVQVKPALKRESLQTAAKKQPKDNRNLYLVKEGVVVAGTKAAVGVSASDMAKRLALERSKTQMLKNLNRFVSRYRIVVSNLPQHVDDGKLRRICTDAVGKSATITEARVMRDLRAPVGINGKHPSKGYGFVMFMRHEDALTCLRKLNNNPDIFDKNNRPIVSFSIEDRTALNARKKRLEKSVANNPLANKNNEEMNENQKGYRKRKFGNEKPDETTKRGKFERKNNLKQNGDFRDAGKFVRLQKQQDYGEYTGLTAKEGAQHKMRSNQKLKMQANVHRQNVKVEKKQSKRAQRLKMAAKERVKQPKQKVNKGNKRDFNMSEKKVHAVINESTNFSNLVNKYKSKLAGNSLDRIKAKWYEK